MKNLSHHRGNDVISSLLFGILADGGVGAQTMTTLDNNIKNNLPCSFTESHADTLNTRFKRNHFAQTHRCYRALVSISEITCMEVKFTDY